VPGDVGSQLGSQAPGKPLSKANVPANRTQGRPGNYAGRCQIRREIPAVRAEPNAAHQAISEPDRSG